MSDLHQTVLEPDPSMLLESPSTPTFMSDSEVESGPKDGSEVSLSPPPAKKNISSLSCKESLLPSVGQEYADEEQSDMPRWAAELRYIKHGDFN